MEDRAIDLVLFDLGGVLIELGGVASLQEMAAMVNEEEVWHRWLASPWVRRFERGDCSASEFSVGAVAEWGLAISPERFLDIFRRWPIGPFDGAPELIAEVRRSVPIGCLSNTNTLHWEYQSAQWSMLGAFDFKFLSFELGLVKPDQEMFRHVADRLPVSPNRVLYLDDVALNSDAARSFGFRSEQVRGIDEVRRTLLQYGLIAD